ncbi:hypothetical protein Q5P01_015516 [Channa striata]|uniref:Uncharacterized protein n=1 Tax=Channa striata TaxID=64152 RepID=A0AA88SIV8_CHASR|nr:hypothetical protein Q5P01_015516 [Channa striata]
MWSPLALTNQGSKAIPSSARRHGSPLCHLASMPGPVSTLPAIYALLRRHVQLQPCWSFRGP